MVPATFASAAEVAAAGAPCPAGYHPNPKEAIRAIALWPGCNSYTLTSDGLARPGYVPDNGRCLFQSIVGEGAVGATGLRRVGADLLWSPALFPTFKCDIADVMSNHADVRSGKALVSKEQWMLDEGWTGGDGKVLDFGALRSGEVSAVRAAKDIFYDTWVVVDSGGLCSGWGSDLFLAAFAAGCGGLEFYLVHLGLVAGSWAVEYVLKYSASEPRGVPCGHLPTAHGVCIITKAGSHFSPWRPIPIDALVSQPAPPLPAPLAPRRGVRERVPAVPYDISAAAERPQWSTPQPPEPRVAGISAFAHIASLAVRDPFGSVCFVQLRSSRSPAVGFTHTLTVAGYSSPQHVVSVRAEPQHEATFTRVSSRPAAVVVMDAPSVCVVSAPKLRPFRRCNGPFRVQDMGRSVANTQDAGTLLGYDPETGRLCLVCRNLSAMAASGTAGFRCVAVEGKLAVGGELACRVACGVYADARCGSSVVDSEVDRALVQALLVAMATFSPGGSGFLVAPSQLPLGTSGRTEAFPVFRV